mmetsp:Transcript_21637/g.55090  ORF Transcript_21637/g.55090 Transcript_21637/m.55090 type:complete len:306 (+) Transcript_21637:114-1031(+)
MHAMHVLVRACVLATSAQLHLGPVAMTGTTMSVPADCLGVCWPAPPPAIPYQATRAVCLPISKADKAKFTAAITDPTSGLPAAARQLSDRVRPAAAAARAFFDSSQATSRSFAAARQDGGGGCSPDTAHDENRTGPGERTCPDMPFMQQGAVDRFQLCTGATMLTTRPWLHASILDKAAFWAWAPMPWKWCAGCTQAPPPPSACRLAARTLGVLFTMILDCRPQKSAMTKTLKEKLTHLRPWCARISRWAAWVAPLWQWSMPHATYSRWSAAWHKAPQLYPVPYGTYWQRASQTGTSCWTAPAHG